MHDPHDDDCEYGARDSDCEGIVWSPPEEKLILVRAIATILLCSLLVFILLAFHRSVNG